MQEVNKRIFKCMFFYNSSFPTFFIFVKPSWRKPCKYYILAIDELFCIGEPLYSPISYLIVINVYVFFALKKALKRPFKAILKPV